MSAAAELVPTGTKAIPKDAEVMVAILKDMGVTDYEPRLVNQMLEFTYRYITDVLEDSQAYSNHAGRTEIDADDVKLAVHCRLDHSFTTPPPREFLMEIARLKNNNPLPPIKPHNGPRLPPDRYCLSASNYKLRPFHKRATLTLPSRLPMNTGLGLSSASGAKASPSFSTKQQYINLSSLAPQVSVVSSKASVTGQGVSIITTVTRSNALPGINLQPSSVVTRIPSSARVIKTEIVSSPAADLQPGYITLKRKHDESSLDD